MRFLLLTQYFYPEVGASQVRLGAFTRELTRRGHAVEIVTALPNHPTGRIFPAYHPQWHTLDHWEGMTIHRMWLSPANGSTCKRLLNYFSFAFSAHSGLHNASVPDYLIADFPPLFLSIPAVLAARRWGIPVIFNIADLWPDSVRALGIMREGVALRCADHLERWAYRQATYLNAVTEGIRDTLLDTKQVPAEKVLFLPNGVDIATVHPQPSDPRLARELGLAESPILLYAGTHGMAHGMEVALDAAALLTDTPIKLVFIGNGPQRQPLIELAQARQLPNVVFLEPQPLEYVARLHSLAFAGLSTLQDSAFFAGTRPVKALIAMAAGKPVIYSGAGEGAQIIEDAHAGVVTPAQNAPALAAAIRHLWQHPAEAARLGANGRHYIEQYLSWPAVVDNWLQQLQCRESARISPLVSVKSY